MSQIPSPLFSQIVDLLAPQLENEQARRALLDEALGTGPRPNTFKQHLDFSGPTRAFTTQLVRELAEYGTLGSGELALIAVLETAKGRVGDDRVPAFERAITQLQATSNETGEIVTNDSKSGSNINLVLAIIGTLAGVVSMVVAILALPPGVLGRGGPTATPTSPPTATLPATPIVIAQTNLDIRGGPGPGFAVLGVLSAASQADVIGISADNVWYQVLLLDGRRGWVRAGNMATLTGNPGIIPVIVPTNTPSDTPTATATASDTPTATRTPPPTDTPTDTPVPTDTPTPLPSATPTNIPPATHTPEATNTPLPTAIPAAAYPCEGQIQDGFGRLNQVRLTPSNNSPFQRPVQQGATVEIQRDYVDFGDTWYEIEYENGTERGWIGSQYITPSANCP